MKELQSMARNFTADRPTLEENNTHERIVDLLHGEVDEVRGAGPDELGSELADVLLFTMSLANLHNIDLDKEVREKLAFNMCRYMASDFSEDSGISYEEARLKGKLREPEVKRDFESVV